MTYQAKQYIRRIEELIVRTDTLNEDKVYIMSWVTNVENVIGSFIS